MDEQLLLEHIKWAEGVKLRPYRDSVGVLTIGYGRNLDDNGIRKGEAIFMLQNDMQEALADCRKLSYWNKLDSVRKIVVADMVFNLGLPRFLRFVKLNAALELQDYTLAAVEMRDSKWYGQTGRRAKKLVEAMHSGIWKGTEDNG